MLKFYLTHLVVLMLYFGMAAPAFSQENPQEWTILETYTIPGKASGLAWDGQYLYSGLYSAPGDDNLIYRINPSDGSYTLQCAGPMESCYGLTYDSGSGNLWTTDHPGAYDPGLAIEFKLNGTYVDEFELPATYFSGIAYDNGNFWTTCYYDPDGEVYKLSSSGTVLDQFPTPGAQPWDICKQGSYLWVVDYNEDKIYKINQDGDVVESHDSENIKPSGIVYDGTYLWYVDGQVQTNSTLYKVSLTGEGNPDINLPATAHDYGVVTINESGTWGCLVQNLGDADLEVTYGDISGTGAEFIGWPSGNTVTITPGGSQVLNIEYAPLEAGELDATAVLETNDPVTPQVELHLTGMAVYDGPYIELSSTQHDFGTVRSGAHTRWNMEITNKGDEPLMITNILVSDEENYYVDPRISFPISIETLSSAFPGIWFKPEGSADSHPAVVSIIHNDEQQDTLEVFLDGAGLEKDWEMGDILWQVQLEDPIDASPKAMIGIQDVTGDEIEDVIVCSEDDYVRCFNGNSHGTADLIWETEIYSGSVYHQNSLTVIQDIDGDGYDDIIVGTAWGDRSVVALSGYSGSQLWKYQTNAFGDGGWVYQVDARMDYNEDGFPDVLAASGDDSNDTGPKRVHCLNGKTGVPLWHTPFSGPVFSVIGIEDFTGDGLPDALAGVSNPNETEGSFYSIDGATGLSKWNFVTNGNAVWALAQIDDLNDNGSKEIFAGVDNGEYYFVDPETLFIIKTGNIGPYLILRSIVIDDITRDDYRDILLANSSNRVIVIDGKESGYAINLPIADKCWVADRIDDVSGDEVNDVVAGSLFGTNHTYFIDTYNVDVMFEDNYGSPLDAMKSINDITGDWSMEMVAGGRNGLITCYSGGLNAPVGIPENSVGNEDKISHGSYPNPFRESTTIFLDLSTKDHVTINIYDISGVLIETILDEDLSEGRHEISWNSAGKNIPDGLYFYNILTTGTVVTGRLLNMQ